MKIASYTLINVITHNELHATGCRDLKSFAGERAELVGAVTNDAADIVAAFREQGTIAAEAQVRVMPCCSPVRMAAAGRIHIIEEVVLEEVAAAVDLESSEPAEAEVAVDKPKRSRKRKAEPVAEEVVEA
jgi:hypothetical protein